MGLYIEPDNADLRTWLETVGTRLSGVWKESWDLIPEGYMLVCLVDNGHFDAGLVAFNKGEFDRVVDNPDDRPKTWYLVLKKDVKRVSPQWTTYMGEDE